MLDSLQPQVDYLLFLAGMPTIVAIYQFFAFQANRRDRVHLWGSLWCAVAAVLIVGRWIQMGALDAPVAVLGDRMQAMGAALIAGLSVGATRAAGGRLKFRSTVAILMSGAVALAVLGVTTDLILTSVCDERVDMFGRRYLEPRPGSLHVVLMAYCAYCVGAAVMAVRRSGLIADRERQGGLVVHASVLAPLAINEVLHAMRIVNTAQLMEFGFAFAAVVIGSIGSQRQRRIRVVGDAVERAESSFRSLIEGSLDGVVVYREGEVVFANAAAAELLGRADADELLGMRMVDLSPEQDREDARRRLDRVTPLSGPSLSREAIQRPDGTVLSVEAVRLAIVFDGLPGMAVILRDEAHGEQMRLRTRFVEDVLAAQEEERRRIARELHDEAGQALTGILLGLGELGASTRGDADHARIAALQKVAESTLDDLGRLARGLHPAALEDLGFSAAIERHARELGELHGIDIDVEVVDRGPKPLEGPIATALYRIAQEALTNAIKHGQARHISLVVRSDATGIRATVEDDGCGFDVDADPEYSSEGGLGLHTIRERLALLGGTLEIDTEPGEGTTLFAAIPKDARPPSWRPPEMTS